MWFRWKLSNKMQHELKCRLCCLWEITPYCFGKKIKIKIHFVQSCRITLQENPGKESVIASCCRWQDNSGTQTVPLHRRSWWHLSRGKKSEPALFCLLGASVCQTQPDQTQPDHIHHHFSHNLAFISSANSSPRNQLDLNSPTERTLSCGFIQSSVKYLLDITEAKSTMPVAG